MRQGKVITTEIRQKIEHLAETMHKPTAGKIARKLGLKCGTVYWFMLCNGLVAKKPPSYQNRPYTRNGLTINPYTPEQDARLTALRVQGKKFIAIAEALTAEFGVPRNAHSVHNRAVMLAAFDDDDVEIKTKSPAITTAKDSSHADRSS